MLKTLIGDVDLGLGEVDLQGDLFDF